MATEAEVIQRYQRCVEKLWAMFAHDPLPPNCPAQSWVERLEALLEHRLIGVSLDELRRQVH